MNYINKNRSEVPFNESWYLAERTEVSRLGRLFSLVLQQDHSFRTRHNLCRQGVALAGTQNLRWQGPVSMHAHCTEGEPGFRDVKEQTGTGTGSANMVGMGTDAGTGTGE